MKSKLEQLREVSLAPKPAQVAPGQVIEIPGLGVGRIDYVVVGTAGFTIEHPNGFDRSTVWIPDLSWAGDRWTARLERVGSSGEGPGAERFPGSIGR